MLPLLNDKAWPGWGRVWLLAPFFILLSLFWLTPLGKGVLLSLESDTLFGESTFVGWQHYRDLLSDSRYWRAVLNTFLFTVSTVSLTITLALIFAHSLLRCNRRIQGPLAFGLMIPGLCPPTVLALLFLLVFHGKEGLLNRWVVDPLGFETINWLSDPDFILSAVVIQAIWRWTGFMAFFLLCALNARSQEILDAAKIDGAGFWTRFVHVTLPLIAPTLTFCLIYLIIDCFAQFAGSYVLFGGSGGMNDAGLLLVTYAYQKAFIGAGFGSGAAVSLSIVPWLAGMLVLVAMVPRFIWKEGSNR